MRGGEAKKEGFEHEFGSYASRQIVKLVISSASVKFESIKLSRIIRRKKSVDAPAADLSPANCLLCLLAIYHWFPSRSFRCKASLQNNGDCECDMRTGHMVQLEPVMRVQYEKGTDDILIL